MTREKQIEALATLDEYKWYWDKNNHFCQILGKGLVGYWEQIEKPTVATPFVSLPDYLNSLDAIVPLINKSFTVHDFRKFDISLCGVLNVPNMDLSPSLVLKVEPQKLAEALLRSMNLWTED